LANNHPDVLPPEQKNFPDTEIWAVTEYLFGASDNYVKEINGRQKDDPAMKANDLLRLADLQGLGKLSDSEKKEFDDINRRILLRNTPALVDLATGYKANAANGRVLFSERGCLACH